MRQKENFYKSPIFGVGSDRKANMGLNTIAYHNDFSELLVSTGIIGLVLFLIIISSVSKVSIAFIIPFLFPGFTNSFFYNAGC